MKFKPTDDQVKCIADAPLSYRGLVTRTYTGEAAPRSAIKAFCLQCVGYARADVKTCPARACPLHAYRPYQNTDIEEE